MEDIIIIGGGPAGIMAAISAAEAGSTPLIIDKNRIIGKKILISGNGKCNLTNSKLDLNKYNAGKEFLVRIFEKFDNQNTINFFNSLGISFKEESFGRILPDTEQAVTILDALNEELVFHKVKVKTGEEAMDLEKTDDGLFGVKTKRNLYRSKKIIISCGGLSYPQLRTTGKGYDLVKKFKHTLVEAKPALVPIELKGNWFQKLQGVKTRCAICIRTKEDVLTEYSGELLFTKYGISGPVTLDASRTILDIYRKPGTEICIDFIKSKELVIEDNLKEIAEFRPDKTIEGYLSGILPKNIPNVILGIIGVNPEKRIKELTNTEKIKIISNLKQWPIEIKGPRPFSESMVTSGGVSTEEINPETMESKIVKDLYFAGEIIDVDGESGGYNMQFAFSTGWIAGKNAANSANEE